MFLTFRWFADDDPVPLGHIRQIPGMRGIVSALYDLAPGVPWPAERVAALRDRIRANGLELSVIESIPVHESIKLGEDGRDEAIDAFIASLKAVGKAGVPVVCYNFMPVFDWMRSSLASGNPDGSTSLSYDAALVEKMDPLSGELSLPGWLAGHKKDELARLLEIYRSMDAETLWKNLAYFLGAVVPEAERCGVRLAIHPDDPPWPIFGIPRIIINAQAIRRLLALENSKANGLCLCAGSFGADPGNDIPAMAAEFAHRIAFAHLRNVKITGERCFRECAHWSGDGSLDMGAIVSALIQGGFSGPVRPDHGRMIWGETGKPGYGLYDRALGAQYILGLMERSGSC